MTTRVTSVGTEENPFTSFETRRPIFEGIEAHYNANVVPDLTELDKVREKTHTEAMMMQFFMALLGFAMTLVFTISLGPISLIFGTVLTIILMVVVWGFETKYFILDAKKTLIGGMVSFFGWTYSPESEAPQVFKRLAKLKLFTNFDSETFSDQIQGVAFDREFSLTEIFLTQTETSQTTDANGHTQTESKTVTVFNGCLISIDIAQKFSSETIVLRRGFIFNPKKVKGLKRVGLVSSKFEKKLNAYSSDQVEARYLLDPTLIEQIIAYERSLSGKKLRFAFIDQQLHIVVETGNRFEFKNIGFSVLSKARIATLLREIEGTFDLIEGLLVKAPNDWKDEFGHDAFLTKQELSPQN